MKYNNKKTNLLPNPIMSRFGGKRTLRCLMPLFLILGFLPTTKAEDVATLKGNFAKPPDSARPHVYWYWIEGNISKEGIDADLEAMKRTGIGGAGIYTIVGHGILGPVTTYGPEWQDLFKHAIRKAGELGIEVTLNNSPRGWSSTNGPWITPEMAMKVLTWNETKIEGGKPINLQLNKPETAKVNHPAKDFYRDVIVVAFPTPESEKFTYANPQIQGYGKDFKGNLLVDGNDATGCTMPKPAEKGEKQFFQIEYDQSIEASSITILPVGKTPLRSGKLLVSENKTQWRMIHQFGSSMGAMTVNFPKTKSPYWRVEFDGLKDMKVAEVRFGMEFRIPDWSGKAQYNLYGVDRPKFSPSQQDAPTECKIKKDSIINISSKMDSTGKLTWTPPSGDWTILRFGYTYNDIQKYGYIAKPGSKSPDGYNINEKAQLHWLECDKFNRAALDLHWNNYQKVLFADKTLDSAIKNVHVDSYEGGAQNWSESFPEEFQKRTGYDLMSYFPVMAGRVVDSVQTSERVLWDFRQVCNDLITNNYYGYFQELCKKSGKQFSLEGYHLNQFHCGTVSSKGDIPMCEFWAGPDVKGLQKLNRTMYEEYWKNPGPGNALWFKSGASPAHLYGRPVVGAEAFTANDKNGGDYSTDPWMLKVLGDSAFCGGVNRYVYHVYVHQPWMNQAPGPALACYGTHFERTNTIFEQMKGYHTYVSRCQHLLQQGQFIADVVYSYSQNSPNDVATQNLGTPKRVGEGPRGYDYDICPPDDIQNRMTVEKGNIVIPGCMTYRLLVLPEEMEWVTLPLLKKIGELVNSGATVIGPKPLRSPSLTNQPNADREVEKLAAEIWGDCDGKKATEHVFGKGRVIWGKPVKDVLEAMKVVEDFDAGSLKNSLNYIHRQLKDGELYYVANSTSSVQSAECKFRVSGLVPELWDPVTGEIRALSESKEQDGRTVIPLKFDSRQSYFVMFRQKGAANSAKVIAPNFPEVKPVTTLEGSWMVQFDPKWGGPVQPVKFDQLTDWTKSSDTGIKYYSGKATYRKTFEQTKLTPKDSRVFLNLGELKNMAEVRLNGKNLGIVWCAPWQVEVTGDLRDGGNELEIDVVNLWVNRMIGDEQLPDDCEFSDGGPFKLQLKKFPEWFIKEKARPSGRTTFSSVKHYSKDSTLLPSGLMGPVRLMRMDNN